MKKPAIGHKPVFTAACLNQNERWQAYYTLEGAKFFSFTAASREELEAFSVNDLEKFFPGDLKSLSVNWANPSLKRRPQGPPSLKRIDHFADYFPIPTRKAIKAVNGDYAAEIERLWGEGRTRAARWNKCLAWGYTLWYVARSPFDTIVQYVVKSFRGGG